MTLSDDILRDIAEDVRARIIREIQLADLIFTAQLNDSWEIEKTEDGYVVGSRVLYAAVMDEGRMPGKMPPVSALIPWVRTKIGGKDDKEIKSIAYAVARKIAEKGTEPRHYVKKALFSLEAETA